MTHAISNPSNSLASMIYGLAPKIAEQILRECGSDDSLLTDADVDCNAEHNSPICVEVTSHSEGTAFAIVDRRSRTEEHYKVSDYGAATCVTYSQPVRLGEGVNSDPDALRSILALQTNPISFVSGDQPGEYYMMVWILHPQTTADENQVLLAFNLLRSAQRDYLRRIARC